MAIQEVLLIGVQGGFGRLLAKLLAERGLRVSGVGRRAQDGQLDILASYHQADALTIGDEYRALVAAADCIIICLPDEPTKRVVPLVAESMKAGALLSDVLSVKTHVVDVMREQREDIELLSLHPMFAPSVGFAGQNVVTIPVRTGPKSDELCTWLAAWQANVTEMTAAEHDRMAALTQTTTHAAVLMFGLALLKSGYDPRDAESTSTPAHRVMLAQLSRIAGSDPEVYWKILHDNPNSADVLRQAAVGLDEISRLAADGDQNQLGALFGTLREMLGDDQAALFERSNRLFQLDVDERRSDR
ncbi:MAG: prephenate dehydrogenase [Pirellulales bacterium]|nr:prephenate dehydrogenase [Pirellulales bacterium]